MRRSTEQTSLYKSAAAESLASQSASILAESTLDIAARSLLASQAISGTVASVLVDRALDASFDALFQYAAVRLGDKRASQQMETLCAWVESRDRAALEEPPGPRAQLFRALRMLVRSEPQDRLPPDDARWWRAEGDAPERFAALRGSLSEDDAEILELRHARRLTEEETAYVLEATPELVRAACERGRERSFELYGKRPPSHDRTHEGVMLEAFALAPAAGASRRSLRKPVLATGTNVADRYEVEELLGVGAFADVYRARDREVSGHVVALKILRTRSTDARSVRAALRELQLLASVFHPSVVQLKDHGWHDGHLWFVMPLYRGETLATRLTRGPLGRKDARAIFEQLAEALATMHRAGVRHQDIKPENVFLANLDLDADETSPEARVLPVLLDLGVAAKDAELVLAGTPAYFAPEVAARFARVPDPPPVGPKADVFSLALTLRQALEPRRRAQLPGGAVDAFVAHRARHAPSPPADRALADLAPSFTRWLATSPDKRPTAEAFRRELTALTAVNERRARRAQTLRWVLPVAAAALAIFFSVVAELSRAAAVSRTEAVRASERADRARDRAASISQSLSEQAARREALEADVLRLEQEYQTSRMTREQLASRLARTEAERSVLGDRERTLGFRIRQQTEALEALDADRARVAALLASSEGRLAEVGEALNRERARGAEAEASAAHLSEQLRSAQETLAASLMRLSDLEERVERLGRAERRLQAPLVVSPDVPSTP